jgi:hypothetical protein
MSLTLDGPLLVIFIVLPLLLPFVAGIVLLVWFRKDELDRLIALFTLKPVLAYPLWFYITTTIGTYWYDNWFDNIKQLLGSWLPLIPAIILTIGIIYTFRNMFTHPLAWLFLGLDILRMLNTFILASSDEMDNFSFPFGLVLPSMLAILALIIVATRSKTVNSALSTLQE